MRRAVVSVLSLVSAGLLACSGGTDAGGGTHPDEPAIACDVEDVDFGILERGDSRTRTVRCRNAGTRDERLAAASDGDLDVAIEPRDPVAPGATWTLALTWTAAAAGPWTRELALEQGGVERASLALRGTAVDRCLAFSAGELDLGVVAPGHATFRDLELTNACDRPIAITRFGPDPSTPPGLAVEPAAPFAIPGATDGLPGRVAVRVTYEPPADHRGGAVTARFVVATEDPMFPRGDLLVDAWVGGPAVSCSPASLDLGLATLDFGVTASLACVATGLATPGDEDVLFVAGLESSSPVFTAAIPGGASPLGYRLGESFQVDVTYLPVDEGPEAATIRLLSNAYHEAPVVALTGTGLELPPCELELVPRELRWGLVEPGTEQTMELRVRNQRADAACLVSARLSPDSDPAFTLDAPPAARVLEPSGTLAFPVRFAPPAYRDTWFEGAVQLTSFPYSTVPLRGASAPTCLRPDPEVLDLGAVRPGCATRDREVRLVNACDEPITITSVEPAAGSGAFFLRSAPPLPAVVPPGPGPLVTFAFRAPNAEGTYADRFFLSVEGALDAVPIRLTGVADDAARQLDAWDRRPWTGTCYFLGNQPDLEDGPIDVTVDGQRVEPEDESGTVWQYRPDEVAVCFDPARVPPDGARVEISYLVDCGS